MQSVWGTAKFSEFLFVPIAVLGEPCVTAVRKAEARSLMERKGRREFYFLELSLVVF